MEIYDRVYNDILINKFTDCYLYNQEGDINSFNTLKKRSKIRTIDGGKIIKRTTDYCGNFFYDSKDLSLIVSRLLLIEFHSFSNHSGLDFLDYINSVLKADPNIFVRTKGLLVQDIRKYILETKQIKIYNTVVDNKLIKTISAHFKNLENIDFINCLIKKECNFNKISSNVELTNSILEDIQSFSSFSGDLITSKTEIKKISPSVILSKKISLIHNKNNNELLKELFLKCNFPNLKEFSILPEETFIDYSFEDSFKYLPDSASMLESLSIEGKVKSLDFLTKFKYLIKCQILSICDDYGAYCPYVTNGSERKKIQERNKLEIEISKILNPNDDIKGIETKTEYDRILNLIRFNQLLSYSEREKEFLLNNKDIINYFINNKDDGNINYYYKALFDKLRLSIVDSDLDTLLSCGHKIKIYNNMLYYYKFGGFDKKENNKKIVIAKPFIYYLDGKPIVFEKTNHKGHPINTIEEAKKISSKIYHPKYPLEMIDYNNFLDLLNELKKSNKSITIGDFKFGLQELSINSVNPQFEFSKLGKAGKQISYLFDYYKRLEQREKYLEEKEAKYKNILNKLLIDNYDNFSFEERKYLYINWSNFNYKLKYDIDFLKNISIDMEVDESLFDTINAKTNGLYKRYISILKLINIQKNVLGRPGQVEIDKELIKKINL